MTRDPLQPAIAAAMETASASSSLERIRERTRGEHERTERAIEERFFGSGVWTREAYRELLAAFLGVYAPLEEHLAPAVRRHAPSLAGPSRTDRLRRDLRTLGMSREEIDALPLIADEGLPKLSGRSATLGCLYVVEGSQLGHRVLWKQIRPRLRPSAGADAFLGRSPDRVRERWQQFGQVFERCVAPGGELRTATRTARSTFRAYREWMS